jgi:hypothetical protein
MPKCCRPAQVPIARHPDGLGVLVIEHITCTGLRKGHTVIRNPRNRYIYIWTICIYIYDICNMYIYIYISYINKWTIPIISDLQRQLNETLKNTKTGWSKKTQLFSQPDCELQRTPTAFRNCAYHLIVWQLVVFLIDSQISRCLPAVFHRSRAIQVVIMSFAQEKTRPWGWKVVTV